MENKQYSDQIFTDRRNLIKGGIAAAATVPWIAGSSAFAHPDSNLICPDVAQSVLPYEEHIIGISAYSINARVREPSSNILADQIGNYDREISEAIASLLQTSYFYNRTPEGGQVDGLPDHPRNFGRDNHFIELGQSMLVVEGERTQLARLLFDPDSSIYWVPTGSWPWILYVVNRAREICLALVPFVKGIWRRFSSVQIDGQILEQFWEEITRTIIELLVEQLIDSR